MAALHFGVTLPQIKRTWAETRDAAVEFDRLGFDSLWVCDHLYGVPAPQNAILEAWSLLTAVAPLTERAELGTLVTPPNFRNPAVFAKQVATIDQISGGRVVVGLGSGWFQQEFEGYGCPFPAVKDRMQALDETAELLTRMWTEEQVSFDGRWAKADGVFCEPKPVRRPPILIGGGGEKLLMGIAARRADIWNNSAAHQSALAHKVKVFRQRCEEAGRDPAEVTISQQCNVVIAPDAATAQEHLEKAKRIYGGHMGADLEEHGIWGAPDRVIDCIDRHVAAGCTHFVIEFFGRDTKEPARLFAETVLPHYRR
ncbi:MAG: LLM class flavin-dependent oxidoreductase [Acidimicrobiales bacterium]